VGEVVDALVEVVLLIENGGVLLSSEIVDDANVWVRGVVETAAKFVVVECETGALWSDAPVVVVIALGARFNVVDALDVGFAVGEADLDGKGAITSDSSMR
jgi:hypothetical protein